MLVKNMLEDDIEVAIKVLIVGNGVVGKSSMIQRYCRGTFTKSYKKTIGVDFLEKQLRVLGEDVRLMLWDTAGQEEFDALTRSYYRGAQACVVAFSTTDRDSLLAVRKWRRKVEDECGDIPMVLVQNKIDLIAQAEMSTYEAERVAADARMKLYRTSVKEDLNVDLVFQHLAENYVKKIRSTDSIDSGFHSIGIGPMTRSLQYNCDNIGYNQCEMVRYRGGRRLQRKQEPGGGGGRSRSKERPRHKYTAGDSSYTPVIADYLNSPMFDSLHQKSHSPSISLLSRPSQSSRKFGHSGHFGKHSQPIGIISQCKVL